MATQPALSRFSLLPTCDVFSHRDSSQTRVGILKTRDILRREADANANANANGNGCA
jgi:hypothetical protein